MELVLIIAGWFILGWVGYRIAIDDWTRTLDLTRADRTFARWMFIPTGVFGLMAGLFILLFMFLEDHPSKTSSRSKEVVKPRQPRKAPR